MKRVSTACIIAIVCLGATAQEARVSTIETEGIGDVDTVAAQVEFCVNVQYRASTMLEATNKALEFEPALREALKTDELSPAESVFSNAVVASLQAPDDSPDTRTVSASVRLRFYAAPYVTGAEGPREFAVLCDKLADIAKSLQGSVEGPTLLANDPEAAEQSAIVRATEKAYPAAKAIAGVMKGQIVAVDNVSVQSVTWNTIPRGDAPQPELRKLTCTAKIRVIYAFATSQP